MIKYATLVLLLTASGFAFGEPTHHCEKDAVIQAKKLLDFHFGLDDRTEIDQHVTILKPNSMFWKYTDTSTKELIGCILFMVKWRINAFSSDRKFWSLLIYKAPDYL